MILETKMVSFMKWTKDTMKNPPSDATIDKLIATAVSGGFTHGELAHPLGMPNGASEMARWTTKMYAAGLKPTFRCSDPYMEGIYNFTKAVGPNRKPQQYYIDQATDFIKSNPGLFKDGAEWAIYTERTEGIWNDATSWIWPNDPNTFANFFVALHDACAVEFTNLGVKVAVGLSSINGSEALSKWFSKTIPNKYGYLCVDHYTDSDPDKLARDLRAMKAYYGKPIYLQESAPDRFKNSTQAQIDAYFVVIKSLIDDGTIAKYGYWGMWFGTPEACINFDFTLNAIGLGLKALTIPVPTPNDPPTPPATTTGSNAKWIKDKNSATIYLALPMTTPEALISYGLNFGKPVPHIDDHTPQWDELNIEGELTLK